MVQLDISESRSIFASVETKSTLFEWIQSRRFEDSRLCGIHDQVLRDESRSATLGFEVILRYDGRICGLRVEGLIQLILREAHTSKYSSYPRTTKIYRDLRQQYWWIVMKRDIADFIAYCLCFQWVKDKHQMPSGLI